MARLGPLLGAKETGICVYELPPGQAVCPYHYECGEEEWLLVLSGNPTLRTPDGEERLAPWDVACFPRGPEGAHGIRNDTEETARVLMFSTVVVPVRDRLSGLRQGRDLDRRPGRRTSSSAAPRRSATTTARPESTD